MNRRRAEFVFFWALIFCTFGPSAAKGVVSPDNITIASNNQHAFVPNEIIVKLRPGVANNTNQQSTGGITWPSSLQRLNNKYKNIKTQPLGRGFKINEQKIKDLAKKEPSKLNSEEKHILARAKRAPRGAVIPDIGNIYKIQFDLDANDSIQDILRTYRKDPAIEYAELNYIRHFFSLPDDSYYSVQWALNNTGQSYPIPGGQNASGTSDADIDAPEAWDIYTGSSDVIVAVVDSGVDYTHKDLAGKMWTDQDGHYGYDFGNNDNNPIDELGHGTHCAGIIAAGTNNGRDIAGVCWNARIMTVKCSDPSNSITDAYAVSAIHYAVDNGADVISCSWGGTVYSQTLEEAINYAYTQGVAVVAAAGNDNSSSPTYPAYFNHVISVAATDSADNKASFSNYGEWIDIAAPGVDILSLRAHNTDMYLGSQGYVPGDRFIPFGDPKATMYIASGTSMSCPQVSGTCALLLSVNPALTGDELNAILADTADPIADGICYSDGRLNISCALSTAIQTQRKGRITFDRSYYNCDSNAVVFLTDGDLKGKGTQIVSVTTTGGDSETLVLTEKNPAVGAFSGIIHIFAGSLIPGDGILQVTNVDIISVIYNDADDGTGNYATATDTAEIDCVPPVILNVQMDVRASNVIVTFNANEPVTGKVSCGLVCGGPYNLEGDYMGFRTSHTIELSPLLQFSTYYLVVTAADASGNQTVDSNSSNCYSFTTTGTGNIYVPSQYPTIQQAIDFAWPGSVIIVADGLYTGQGNRDIDFLGKAITVKSENGPDSCIIDCQANENDPHRGFHFQNYETADSVLDGFTITNGFGPSDYWDNELFMWRKNGGAISCSSSNPIIKNCKIIANRTSYAPGHEDGLGAGIFCEQCSPSIINCKILNNYGGLGNGGGIYGILGNITVENCQISGNTAGLGCGVYIRYDQPLITGCVINNNQGVGGGRGSLYFKSASPTIINCLITNNTAYPGGICCWNDNGGDLTVRNCTIADNAAAGRGSAVCWYNGRSASVTNCIAWNNANEFDDCTVNYSCTDRTCSGTGIIYSDPCFVRGPLGNFYLSQIDSGQSVNSGCVNAGSNTSKNLGLNSLGTRTDGFKDTGIVDLGYHYPVGKGADLNGDVFVNFLDFEIMASQWLQQPDPCDPNSGDISMDSRVDIVDLSYLAFQWLTYRISKAIDPEPSDNADDININVILQWSPGENAASHDVYFGTGFNEVYNADISSAHFMGNQDANYWDSNNYAPAGLEFNIAYYWRIDEVNATTTIKGDVWRFTTYSVPHQATNPNPVNGQSFVDPNVVVNWFPGKYALTHNVYFGTDYDEVESGDINDVNVFMGNKDVNYWDVRNLDPNGLEPNTLFYWRIDEVGPGSTTKGDVWSFSTTRTGCEPSIVGWWKFDEGTGVIAYDSARNNNGTFYGNPQWVPGKIGPWAIDCNGTGDYIRVPDNDSLTPSKQITIAFWLYNRGGQWAGIYKYADCPDKISKGSPGNSRAYAFAVSDSGASFVVCQAVNTMDNISITDTISLNEWHHITATFDNGQAAIYIDGQLKNTKTLCVTSIMNDAQPLIIGGYWEYCTPSFYNRLNGQIDDVRIYNRALSADEIWQLYQSGL